MTTDPNTIDPVEARAQQIVAGWDQEERDKQLARARSLAQIEAAERTSASRAKDPLHQARLMVRAGMTQLVAAWPGCPAPPNLGVPSGPFAVDEAGVWYCAAAEPWRSAKRYFVCTPAFGHDGHFYALLGKRWNDIRVDRPRNFVGADAGSRLILAALVEAGVKVGTESVDVSRAADRPDRRAVGDYARWWLTGVFNDVVSESVLRTVTDFTRETLADGAATVGPPDGRQGLGEVLSRMPSDISERRVR